MNIFTGVTEKEKYIILWTSINLEELKQPLVRVRERFLVSSLSLSLPSLLIHFITYFIIGVQLLYNVVFVSVVHQGESAIHMPLPPGPPSPTTPPSHSSRSTQSTELSSLGLSPTDLEKSGDLGPEHSCTLRRPEIRGSGLLGDGCV